METMTVKLYKAAASGNVAALEEMMQENVNILGQVSHSGNTALHISALNGRQEFVQRLLQIFNEKSDQEAAQRPSFLTAQNEEKSTALHEAVKGGDHAQIVEMLIDADSELARICNSEGESPLFTASACGRLNALKKLLAVTDSASYTRSDGQTCLHHALFYHRDEVVETLIEEAPELCKQVDRDWERTPLHFAALRGCRKSIVEKLLQGDVTCSFRRDKPKGQTPLHLAAEHGHVGIVRCILDSAKDCVGIRDKDGKTALHYAVENAQGSVVRCLVCFASVINIADKDGYTAADIAKQK